MTHTFNHHKDAWDFADTNCTKGNWNVSLVRIGGRSVYAVTI